MKKYFLLIVSSFFLCRAQAYHNRIIQISIPKAGTHLGKKCLMLLTQKKSHEYVKHISNYLERSKEFNLWFDMPNHALQEVIRMPDNRFVHTHLSYTKERADILLDSNMIILFMYRDPRDQLISLLFYMYKNAHWFPELEGMSFDDRLMDLICNGAGMNGTIPPTVGGIAALYNAYLPWQKVPGVVSIRFEDLVGPQGGGSESAQLKAIQLIARHVGLKISPQKIKEVTEKLFGGTQTFRKGQIGAWREHFKQHHIDVFKERAGDLLIKLGYEKDKNW